MKKLLIVCLSLGCFGAHGQKYRIPKYKDTTYMVGDTTITIKKDGNLDISYQIGTKRCSISKNLNDDYAFIKKYGKAIYNKCEANKLWIGMNRDMVARVLGSTDNETDSYNAHGKYTTYIFDGVMYDKGTVDFTVRNCQIGIVMQNNKVIAIHDITNQVRW